MRQLRPAGRWAWARRGVVRAFQLGSSAVAAERYGGAERVVKSGSGIGEGLQQIAGCDIKEIGSPGVAVVSERTGLIHLALHAYKGLACCGFLICCVLEGCAVHSFLEIRL